MKTISKTLIIGMAVLSLTACKSKKVDPNKVVTEIPATAITGIEVHHGINLKYEQTDDAPHITVSCPKAYATGLNVRMDGTTLVASYKPKAHIADHGVNIEVKAPAIGHISASTGAIVNLGKEFAVSGDVNINCANAANVKCQKFSCQNLHLTASDASQIQLNNINCANIQGETATNALILLDGTTTTATFKEGDGEVRCPKLESANGVKIQK